MPSNGSEPVVFTDEILIVYLTVIARSVRQLDTAHGPGSVARFLEALERSLEVEMSLTRPDEAAQLQLSEMQKALVRLLKTMPQSEDL